MLIAFGEHANSKFFRSSEWNKPI